MKKILSVMLLAVVSASFVFAIDMSAGGGLGLGFNKTTVTIASDYYDDDYSNESTDLVIKGFFDATYVMADLGFAMSLSNTSDGEDTKVATTGLAIGVYGKYPIAVGPAVIFPLAGFEYVANIGYTVDGEDVKGDMDSDTKAGLNQTWIKGGVGADIAVSPTMFVRPIATLGYKFLSSSEQDLIDLGSDFDMDITITTIKFDLSVAVGFKL